MTHRHYYLNRARLAITCEVKGQDDKHTFITGSEFNTLLTLANSYASDWERQDFLRNEWLELNGQEA